MGKKQRRTSKSSTAASVPMTRPAIDRANKASNKGVGQQRPVSNSPATIGSWSPTASTALKALLSARLSAAIWSNISDCDETFNYWEPTHFLIYGSGFQTWEYSPAYAIRSYLYLWLYGFPALVYSSVLQSNKVLVFYFTRCLMALVSSLADAYLYSAVRRTFGPFASRLLLLFLVLSTGMFIASTAFLPSSFAMYCTSVLFAAWLLAQHRTVIFAAAISSLVGWPFSALIGAPFAGERLGAGRRHRIRFIKWALAIGVAIVIPLILVDSFYYGKSFLLAPINIVLYNVFSSRGPELYGREPFHFYFVNLFLNFNLVFLVVLLAPMLMVHIFEISENPKKFHNRLSLFFVFRFLYTFPSKSEPNSYQRNTCSSCRRFSSGWPCSPFNRTRKSGSCIPSILSFVCSPLSC